jgi:hypothetical protein
MLKPVFGLRDRRVHIDRDLVAQMNPDPLEIATAQALTVLEPGHGIVRAFKTLEFGSGLVQNANHNETGAPLAAGAFANSSDVAKDVCVPARVTEIAAAAFANSIASPTRFGLA